MMIRMICNTRYMPFSERKERTGFEGLLMVEGVWYRGRIEGLFAGEGEGE
jgi:hypothetical protein